MPSPGDKRFALVVRHYPPPAPAVARNKQKHMRSRPLKWRGKGYRGMKGKGKRRERRNVAGGGKKGRNLVEMRVTGGRGGGILTKAGR